MEDGNVFGLNEPKSILKTLAVSEIRESEVALRSVQRDTEEYAGLVDSVRLHGVLKPILVREDVDPDTGEQFYWVVDGLQRFNACKDAGRQYIDAKVVAMNDAQVLEAQIIANIFTIETKPVQYSDQLRRILAGNPTMTINSLAHRLSRSFNWISDRLGLLKLTKEIGQLVDSGAMNLTNAYSLAKLPPDEQELYKDRALTLQPQEFVPMANSRVKELREAKRQGRVAAAAEFVPVAHLQKIAALKGELENGDIANVLVNRTNVRTAVEGFKLALQWALHLDPISIEQAKAAEEARQAKLAADKEKRKAEREAQRKEKMLAETAAG